MYVYKNTILNYINKIVYFMNNKQTNKLLKNHKIL